MRAEVLLIEQSFGITGKDGNIREEVRAWGHLFSKKYYNRTLIGIMMMFFQRKCPFVELLAYAHQTLQNGAGSTRCYTTAQLSCALSDCKATQ